MTSTTAHAHHVDCPVHAWLQGLADDPAPRPTCWCPLLHDVPARMPCTIVPVFEETPMPVDIPAAWRHRPAPTCAETPTVVTFWLELDPGASTADGVVFASEQHTARQTLPFTEWVTLGRPGRIESQTVAR